MFVKKIENFGLFSRRRYGGICRADVPSAAKRLSRRNPLLHPFWSVP